MAASRQPKSFLGKKKKLISFDARSELLCTENIQKWVSRKNLPVKSGWTNFYQPHGLDSLIVAYEKIQMQKYRELFCY